MIGDGVRRRYGDHKGRSKDMAQFWNLEKGTLWFPSLCFQFILYIFLIDYLNLSDWTFK